MPSTASCTPESLASLPSPRSRGLSAPPSRATGSQDGLRPLDPWTFHSSSLPTGSQPPSPFPIINMFSDLPAAVGDPHHPPCRPGPALHLCWDPGAQGLCMQFLREGPRSGFGAPASLGALPGQTGGGLGLHLHRVRQQPKQTVTHTRPGLWGPGRISP